MEVQYMRTGQNLFFIKRQMLGSKLLVHALSFHWPFILVIRSKAFSC